MTYELPPGHRFCPASEVQRGEEYRRCVHPDTEWTTLQSDHVWLGPNDLVEVRPARRAQAWVIADAHLLGRETLDRGVVTAVNYSRDKETGVYSTRIFTDSGASWDLDGYPGTLVVYVDG